MSVLKEELLLSALTHNKALGLVLDVSVPAVTKKMASVYLD